MFNKWLVVGLFILSSVISVDAQTAGTLTVSGATVSYGGTYSPNHVLAVWVQSKTGAFIRTLIAYAGVRKNYLTSWKTATSGTFNTVDAITGATLGQHTSFKCTWDGTNLTHTVLGDDTYNLMLEMTEGGNVKLMNCPFKKAKTVQTLVIPAASGFSAITISWTPLGTPVDAPADEGDLRVFPNPVKDNACIRGTEFIRVNLYDLNARKMITFYQQPLDFRPYPTGCYVLEIVTEHGTFSTRILKHK